MKDNNVTGSISEHIAIIYLQRQGYELFKNVKGTGPVDIIAWNKNTNETLMIDVKTVRKYIRKDGTFEYNIPKINNSFVKILCVDGDTDEVFWIKEE